MEGKLGLISWFMEEKRKKDLIADHKFIMNKCHGTTGKNGNCPEHGN